MSYFGDFPVNAVARMFWNTNGADGASITRSTDGTLKIYKDGSVTERTSLAGVTQTKDHDGNTGVHLVAVDLSDNTDAGFYAAGSRYALVMTGMVIDTKTVNAVIGSFSIELAGGALALLKNASYGLANLVRSTVPANTLDVSATGEVGLDFANIKDATGAKTLTNITVPVVTSLTNPVLLTPGTGTGQLDITSGVVKANLVQILATALTETAGNLAAAFKKFFNVTTPTGTVNSIPDAVAGADNGLAIKGTVMGKSPATLAAGDVSGNLPADVVNWKGAAAPAMTGDAYARLGAAGAGLTALGDTRIANLDTTVSSRAPEAAGNVAAIKAKTDNLPTDPASNTQVNTRLAAASYTAPDNAGVSAIKTKTDNLPAVPASEGNVQGHVADALAAYDPPTRTEATADKAAILAAVAALNDITVGELLNGDLSDSLSFPANSLADRLRKLFWILCNRMAIVDATGAFTAYKGDGVTPGATGTIVDNGTNTVRSAPTWP